MAYGGVSERLLFAKEAPTKPELGEFTGTKKRTAKSGKEFEYLIWVGRLNGVLAEWLILPGTIVSETAFEPNIKAYISKNGDCIEVKPY